MVPKTRYAKSGELNIAYQIVGDGPFDLVYVPGWIFLVTSTVRDLTSGSGLVFEDRGTRALKGVPRDWHLFSAS
ncbi:MAG: hypothetical protein E6H91_10580 [Chloroflexi bacterium]|nr:MAG: hypothetical protein E6H91_10580 [Chloroflexota bacterium]